MLLAIVHHPVCHSLLVPVRLMQGGGGIAAWRSTGRVKSISQLFEISLLFPPSNNVSTSPTLPICLHVSTASRQPMSSASSERLSRASHFAGFAFACSLMLHGFTVVSPSVEMCLLTMYVCRARGDKRKVEYADDGEWVWQPRAQRQRQLPRPPRPNGGVSSLDTPCCSAYGG